MDVSIIFNFFKRKKILHLRYVLQVAILIEQEGEQFYRQLAQLPSDTKVKELCFKLAHDESEHKKLFEEFLSHWISLPVDEEYLKSYIQKLKKKGLFYIPSFLSTSVEDLLKHAIEYENTTADFYQSLEKEFTELWKQMHIHQLVIIERGHADNLKSLN